MIRYVPHALVFTIVAAAIALGIAELRTARAAPAFVADVGTQASVPPPPESARAPAPAIIEPGYMAYRHQPAIAAAPEPWERGEVIALGILGVFAICSALARHDAKRAAIWTVGVTATGSLVAVIMAGVTPTMPMILGAIAAAAGIAVRSPVPPRARESERGSTRGTIIVWLACLAIAFVACARYAKPTTNTIVDCSLVETEQNAADLQAMIRDATNLDGTIDWTRIRETLGGWSVAVAGCALRRAIAELLAERGARLAPAPSEAALRGGWERIRDEMWPERRYLPEVW